MFYKITQETISSNSNQNFVSRSTITEQISFLIISPDHHSSPSSIYLMPGQAIRVLLFEERGNACWSHDLEHAQFAAR